MNIRITADSTCDLGREYIEKHNITIIPLRISMNGKDHTDGVDLTPDEIIAHVAGGGDLPKTSAVNAAEYLERFEPLLKECDAIIHFNIGSDFSSCHVNALAAAEGMPVYCIDSQNLSSGIGLLLAEAVDMVGSGCGDPAAIAEHVKSLVPKANASFILDRLDFIYKGGRCSMVSMLGANLLHLRPCIEVKDGKMVVDKKFRGSYERCLKQYVADRLRDPASIDSKRLFITHSGVSPETVEAVRSQVAAVMAFDEILVVRAGCSITSHCGENTLGLLFINK